MFERFTDRARRSVVLAQEEARLLNHNYIGTEHILLGVIHEGEGVAGQAMESLGVSLEAVRTQIGTYVGPGETAPSGHIPFTPRAKKVLELSLREALQLGDSFIGTEHILLGLIREGEGLATKALVALGFDLAEVRRRVLELAQSEGAQGLEKAPAHRPTATASSRSGRRSPCLAASAWCWSRSSSGRPGRPCAARSSRGRAARWRSRPSWCSRSC